MNAKQYHSLKINEMEVQKFERLHADHICIKKVNVRDWRNQAEKEEEKRQRTQGKGYKKEMFQTD